MNTMLCYVNPEVKGSNVNWRLTFWPLGQCMPSDCYSYSLRIPMSSKMKSRFRAVWEVSSEELDILAS